MKKIHRLAIATVLSTALVGLTGPAALAASAKNAMSVSGLALVRATSATNNWDKVLGASIHVASQKDLIAGASLETGLYTQTQVKSKNGTTDTSSAGVQIEVRVLVDLNSDGRGSVVDENGVTINGFDLIAAPGYVVYDKRVQTLSATLGGIIQSCTDLNLDGTIDVTTECTVTDEDIDLILETMGAHHFNFVVPNLAVGTHRLELQARITSSTGSMSGSSSAAALIGKGSFTVEEVRAVNSKDSAGAFTFDM
ncbi:MAG: hypothetical protein ACJ8NR_16340 [Sulfurifustis sp.]